MQRALEAAARLAAGTWLGMMVGATVAAVHAFGHFGREAAGKYVPELFRWTDWFGVGAMALFVFAARASRWRVVFSAVLAAVVVVTRFVVVPRVEGNDFWHRTYELVWVGVAAGAAILVVAGAARAGRA